MPTRSFSRARQSRGALRFSDGPATLPRLSLRPLLGACCALLVSLTLVTPAGAVVDGPIDVYLEHLEPLTLEWPAAGTVTDGYGTRWGRMHLGIDVGILTSLDVRAAASGTVTASGWLTGYEGYGNVVMVDAGGGYSVMYAHLSTLARRSRPVAGRGRPDRRGRLHRLVHGHASALRAAPERRAGRSRFLFAIGRHPPLE